MVEVSKNDIDFLYLVNCPIGYFFDGTSCQACAVNQYQDQEAQNSCKSCPAGTSTSGQQASKKLQDCQGGITFEAVFALITK